MEGVVSRASEVESEEYFQSRPKASQISATVSSQSEPIPCREVSSISEMNTVSY